MKYMCIFFSLLQREETLQQWPVFGMVDSVKVLLQIMSQIYQQGCQMMKQVLTFEIANSFVPSPWYTILEVVIKGVRSDCKLCHEETQNSWGGGVWTAFVKNFDFVSTHFNNVNDIFTLSYFVLNHLMI